MRILRCLLLAMFVLGCGDPATVEDGGRADSGATDSGATDSGATDSGATDSGATDSGAALDAGTESDAGGTDAGGDQDGGAPLCSLPSNAPLTEAFSGAGFNNVTITWDGAGCGVTSDGTDSDALMIFTDLDGLSGQSWGTWVIDSTTGGTILGTNVLDAIPADTAVTVQLSTPGGASLELTFTLSSAAGLTLTMFRVL